METKKNEHNVKETARVEAFSDAVFAIAITLLVLELIAILHTDSKETLVNTCLHHWTSFVAFIIGFITILVCWINHHIALEYIRKTDTTFFWINGFLLFLVTFTPFPTAILAEYLGKDGRTALAIFGFNYFLISVAADLICSYAYHHHLIEDKDREFYSSFKLIYRYSIFYTFLVFLLCFVSVGVPIFLYALLFILFAAPKKFASRLHQFRTNKKTKARK